PALFQSLADQEQAAGSPDEPWARAVEFRGDVLAASAPAALVPAASAWHPLTASGTGALLPASRPFHAITRPALAEQHARPGGLEGSWPGAMAGAMPDHATPDAGGKVGPVSRAGAQAPQLLVEGGAAGTPALPQAAPTASPAPAPRAPTDPEQLRQSYDRLPLSFEANAGQADPAVRFLAHGRVYSLALTPQEAVFQLPAPAADHSAASADTALHMQLVGANPAPQLVGQEELPGKVNYSLGNDPTRWHTDIPTFAQVEYRGVYPGIDLVYHGQQRQLEYDFLVAPGADPQAIALAFPGAAQVATDAQGDLVVHTAGGDWRQQRPVIYQEAGGLR